MNKPFLNVSVELSNSCNLTCKMCVLSKNSPFLPPSLASPKFLSHLVLKKIFNGLKKLKREYTISLNFHWVGEPLLHPEFNDLVLYSFKNNTKNSTFDYFSLSTNGVLLNKCLNTLIKCASLQSQAAETFAFINFSIDAFEKDTYFKIKGKNGLEVVIDNISLFADSLKKNNLSHPKIHVSYVIMEENIGEVVDFINFWGQFFKKRGLAYEVVTSATESSTNKIYIRRLSSENQTLSDALYSSALSVINSTLKLQPPLKEFHTF